LKIPTATTGEISLYFHIPFCSQKCPYCHFYSITYHEKYLEKFFQALELEWQQKKKFLNPKDKLISIYFGGGSPSLLKPLEIQRILSWVQEIYPITENIEITIEANPKDILKPSFKEFQNTQVNRISIGIQSFDDNLLKALNRNHLADEAVLSIQTAAKYFKNISIDLLYDLPGQTITTFRNSLAKATTLPITHLSLYNLVIEENTPFYKRKKEIEKKMPDEKESLAMTNLACDFLETHQFKRYEISAFAKENYYSRHNTGYWTGRNFLGLGPSAFSYFNYARFQNYPNLFTYEKSLKNHQSPISFQETLSPTNHQKEQLAIALRLTEGIDITLFEKSHGKFSKEIQTSIKKLIDQNLLEINKGFLRLTEKGLLFYDFVAETII